jgi:hypothetical protein
MSLKPHQHDHATRKDLCTHIRADGKRCALPRAANHDSLCLHHLRLADDYAPAQDPGADALVARKLGSLTDLKTRTAVNDALAKLFTLRARKLISARDTAILAYIAQLLLQTLPGVQHEYTQVHEFGGWDLILRKALEHAGIPAPPEPAPVRRSRRRSSRADSPALPASSREFAQQVFSRLADRLASPAQPVPEQDDESAERDSEELSRAAASESAESAEEHQEASDLV